MSECIDSPQRMLLKDLLAQKLVEHRMLTGGNSRYFLPDMTDDEKKDYRKQSLRIYYANNKEKLDEYQKNYRESHREQKRATDRCYNLRKKQEKENAAK